jgi:hypothetical protein
LYGYLVSPVYVIFPPHLILHALIIVIIVYLSKSTNYDAAIFTGVQKYLCTYLVFILPLFQTTVIETFSVLNYLQYLYVPKCNAVLLQQLLDSVTDSLWATDTVHSGS